LPKARDRSRQPESATLDYEMNTPRLAPARRRDGRALKLWSPRLFPPGRANTEADCVLPPPLCESSWTASPSTAQRRTVVSQRDSVGLAAPPPGSAEPEQAAHHVLEKVGLRSAGRRGAAHEVKHLAVLHAVIGDAVDLAALVEVNRKHVLIGHLDRHER